MSILGSILEGFLSSYESQAKRIGHYETADSAHSLREELQNYQKSKQEESDDD